MKKSNTLILTSSFMDDNIVNHFEFIGLDQYIDEEKTEFEAKFKFSRGNSVFEIIAPYSVQNDIASYDKGQIAVYDQNKQCFSYPDENLSINMNSINPDSMTLSQQIKNLIERERRKRIENAQDSIDMQITYDVLNQKMR